MRRCNPLAMEALEAIDRLKQANPQRRTDGLCAEGLTIPMSSLSVEDFHSLSDEQLDALEARFLAKYGEDGKTADAPSQQGKQE